LFGNITKRVAKIFSQVKQKFLSVLLKGAFVFEPLAPKAISYYISQRLKEIKKTGLISEFHTKTKRLHRFHYLIVIDLDLNSIQTDYLIKKILPKLVNMNKYFN
jgi:hypothetical protein